MNHLEEHERNTAFNVEPFDSTVWEVVSMAGRIDLGAELKAAIETRDWQNIQDIFENITHQMTFYTAVYVVLPHMVQLLEQVMEEGDLEHAHMLIWNLGICLATDIPGNRMGEPDSPLMDDYQAAAKKLCGLVKHLINTRLQDIQELSDEQKSTLLAATLAILGERELVFAAMEAFAAGAVEELHFMCGGGCEFFAECVDPYEEESEIGSILPQEYEPETWDGVSYDDPFVWTTGIAELFGAEEQIEVLRWFYGTLICPECGQTKRVLDYMITYLTEA